MVCIFLRCAKKCKWFALIVYYYYYSVKIEIISGIVSSVNIYVYTFSIDNFAFIYYSLLSEAEVITSVEKWLSSQDPNLLEDVISKFDDAKLSEHVLSINIERNCANSAVSS